MFLFVLLLCLRKQYFIENESHKKLIESYTNVRVKNLMLHIHIYMNMKFDHKKSVESIHLTKHDLLLKSY